MKRKSHPRSSLRRPAASRFETHLGYWLRCVSNRYSQSLSRRVEDKGVTLAEWVVMRELYDGDLRPTTLAEKLGLTRGAVSKLAQRLEAKLMVTQQAIPGPGDGRAQMLGLTDTGRSVVPVLAQSADVTDDEFFGHIDPHMRVLIVSILRDIVRRKTGGRRPLWAPPAD